MAAKEAVHGYNTISGKYAPVAELLSRAHGRLQGIEDGERFWSNFAPSIDKVDWAKVTRQLLTTQSCASSPWSPHRRQCHRRAAAPQHARRRLSPPCIPFPFSARRWALRQRRAVRTQLISGLQAVVARSVSTHSQQGPWCRRVQGLKQPEQIVTGGLTNDDLQSMIRSCTGSDGRLLLASPVRWLWLRWLCRLRCLLLLCLLLLALVVPTRHLQPPRQLLQEARYSSQ